MTNGTERSLKVVRRLANGGTDLTKWGAGGDLCIVAAVQSVGNVNNSETLAEIVGLTMSGDRRARLPKRESC